MQRKVARVFKALSKKGMTRAFLEIDGKDFFYPMTREQKKRRGVRKPFLLGLGAVILLSAGITLFDRLVDYGIEAPNFRKKTVNRRDQYGMGPLFHAVIRENLEEIKKLLEEGAGIDDRDRYGWTPLHWAVFKKNPQICRYLTRKEARVTTKTRRRWFKYPAGLTPGQMAEIGGDPVIIGILVPNRRREKGQVREGEKNQKN